LFILWLTPQKRENPKRLGKDYGYRHLTQFFRKGLGIDVMCISICCHYFYKYVPFRGADGKIIFLLTGSNFDVRALR